MSAGAAVECKFSVKMKQALQANSFFEGSSPQSMHFKKVLRADIMTSSAPFPAPPLPP